MKREEATGPRVTWPSGYGRRVLARVDSTLDEARRVVPQLAGPEWILALEQTAARGRRGRAWHMPRGNFAATLVMRPDGAPGVSALRSFVAALALYDAVAACLGSDAGLALKWPNDVLLHGGKLAGILLEGGGGAQMSYLAIGIGVNLVAAPGAAEVEPGAVPPIALSQAGVTVAPEAFLDALAAHFAVHEAQFTQYGFAPIRHAWLGRAARRGETITARTSAAEFVGRFVDMDNEGQLVLETPAGRRAIPAADVFF